MGGEFSKKQGNLIAESQFNEAYNSSIETQTMIKLVTEIIRQYRGFISLQANDMRDRYQKANDSLSVFSEKERKNFYNIKRQLEVAQSVIWELGDTRLQLFNEEALINIFKGLGISIDSVKEIIHLTIFESIKLNYNEREFLKYQHYLPSSLTKLEFTTTFWQDVEDEKNEPFNNAGDVCSHRLVGIYNIYTQVCGGIQLAHKIIDRFGGLLNQKTLDFISDIEKNSRVR